MEKLKFKKLENIYFLCLEIFWNSKKFKLEKKK